MEQTGLGPESQLSPLEQNRQIYDLPRWGKDYFAINEEGHLVVCPEGNPDRQIDLYQLIKRLEDRHLQTPILLRFQGILEHRLNSITQAFSQAIEEFDYQQPYRCIYPIKVNQQRQVVEEIVELSKSTPLGLEAGSKPELIAVLASADANTPIFCNGFKDQEFIEMALLAQKMGRSIFPIIEKASELEIVLQQAAKLSLRPTIGVRVKLATRGAGRWQTSAGFHSKFGLTISETVDLLEHLKKLGMEDCLQLLHFHLGSQIPDIRPIKRALVEAARIYAELHRMGAEVKYLDVGGGLGIDYDGSQSVGDSSLNYTLQEYANNVVFHVAKVCNDAGVPHPQLLSESGRALVAYPSMLIFNIVGTSQLAIHPEEIATWEKPTRDDPLPLQDLWETYHDLTAENALEFFHDSQQELDNAFALFSAGYFNLEQRGKAEKLYWAICSKIRELLSDEEAHSGELRDLDTLLADRYFANFSVFQSVPDSWAIGHLFPIMPIHRLNEPVSRQAILGDISCDSDGQINRYICHGSARSTLPVHPWTGSPYYMAAFLVGAYQEILGDMHNLFGDTHAVHIGLDERGETVIESVVQGDTVEEVLAYVDYSRELLVTQMRTEIESAVRAGHIDDASAGRLLRFFQEGLGGYTYLEGDSSH
ncbi:Biosynthetic arginine decarboxylase [Planctomycetales bacterium 10988]|nr:Biosynthetic arginine decarboxylase [Planctomycetales bacterium 10988]